MTLFNKPSAADVKYDMTPFHLLDLKLKIFIEMSGNTLCFSISIRAEMKGRRRLMANVCVVFNFLENGTAFHLRIKLMLKRPCKRSAEESLLIYMTNFGTIYKVLNF